jgi:hypothetical protein
MRATIQRSENAHDREAPPRPCSANNKQEEYPARAPEPQTTGAKPIGGPFSQPAADDTTEAAMAAFVAYARTCSDEKGDAQVFCDRLFRAFGHAGYKEAGAILEDRVKMQDGRVTTGERGPASRRDHR